MSEYVGREHIDGILEEAGMKEQALIAAGEKHMADSRAMILLCREIKLLRQSIAQKEADRLAQPKDATDWRNKAHDAWAELAEARKEIDRLKEELENEEPFLRGSLTAMQQANMKLEAEIAELRGVAYKASTALHRLRAWASQSPTGPAEAGDIKSWVLRIITNGLDPLDASLAAYRKTNGGGA